MARAIDANVAMKKIREYMEDFPNAHTRLAACRAILSMLGDEDQIPTLTPPNEWVSVEERLPAPTESLVLVYDGAGVGINMAWYSYAMGWKYRTGLPGVEITHWMPLPEPPKEEIKHEID